jgi:hypothetical protein
LAFHHSFGTAYFTVLEPYFFYFGIHGIRGHYLFSSKQANKMRKLWKKHTKRLSSINHGRKPTHTPAEAGEGAKKKILQQLIFPSHSLKNTHFKKYSSFSFFHTPHEVSRLITNHHHHRIYYCSWQKKKGYDGRHTG